MSTGSTCGNAGVAGPTTQQVRMGCRAGDRRGMYKEGMLTGQPPPPLLCGRPQLLAPSANARCFPIHQRQCTGSLTQRLVLAPPPPPTLAPPPTLGRLPFFCRIARRRMPAPDTHPRSRRARGTVRTTATCCYHWSTRPRVLWAAAGRRGRRSDRRAVVPLSNRAGRVRRLRCGQPSPARPTHRRRVPAHTVQICVHRSLGRRRRK